MNKRDLKVMIKELTEANDANNPFILIIKEEDTIITRGQGRASDIIGLLYFAKQKIKNDLFNVNNLNADIKRI